MTAVLERSSKGVRVTTRARRPQADHHNPSGADQDLPEKEEEYDELVLCVLADTAKEMLGKKARWIEKKILGVPKWSDDVTVTHNVSRGLCWVGSALRTATQFIHGRTGHGVHA